MNFCISPKKSVLSVPASPPKYFKSIANPLHINFSSANIFSTSDFACLRNFTKGWLNSSSFVSTSTVLFSSPCTTSLSSLLFSKHSSSPFFGDASPSIPFYEVDFASLSSTVASVFLFLESFSASFTSHTSSHCGLMASIPSLVSSLLCSVGFSVSCIFSLSSL